ncbi:efflux RND transporter periplasmic adaptor subunit [Patescibacteria group bacterium]
MQYEEPDRYDLVTEKKDSKLSKFLNVLFTIGLVVGIILIGMYFFGGCENQEQAQTDAEQTEQADIFEDESTSDVDSTSDAIQIETLEITQDPLQRINFQKVGTVSPYKSATVTAQTSGTVNDFSFDEGDNVDAGDQIAQITDSTSTAIAMINFETALKTLENSQKSLDSTKNSVSKDIQSAQIGVGTAQIGLQNAIDSYNNSIRAWEEQLRSSKLGIQSAELGLNAAQENYYNSIESSDIGFENVLDQSLSSIISSLTLIESSYDTVNGFLVYEDELSSITSSSRLEDIRDEKSDLADAYEDLLDEYMDINDDQDSDDALYLIDDILETLDDSQYLLIDVKDVVEDAFDSDELENLSSFLSTTENGINTLQSSIDMGTNSLIMTRQGLENIVLGNQIQPEGAFNGLEASETQLLSARQAYQIAVANRDSQLDAQMHSVELAEKQLEAAVAQLENIKAKSNLQVLGAETQLAQVEGQADIAAVNLGGNEIASPIDGVLLDKYIEEGNYVNPGQKVVRVGDMSKIEVIVSLTSEELGFVKIGQNVQIEAPGGIVTTGKVTKVMAALDPMTKKVDVKIVIPNKDAKFVAGMFADVKFTEAQKESAGVFVPFRSIIFESDGEYVYIVENNKAIKKAVKLGQISGNQLEIIDGISLGDKVITKGAKLVNEGDYVIDLFN